MSFFTSLIGDNKSRIVNDRALDVNVFHSEQSKEDCTSEILQDKVMDSVFIDESKNNKARLNNGASENIHNYSRMPIQVDDKTENEASILNYPITEHSHFIVDDEQKIHVNNISQSLSSEPDISLQEHQEHQEPSHHKNRKNIMVPKKTLFSSQFNSATHEIEEKSVKPQGDNTNEFFSIETNEQLINQPDSFSAEKKDTRNKQSGVKSSKLNSKLFVEPLVETLNCSSVNKAPIEMAENNKSHPEKIRNKIEKKLSQNKEPVHKNQSNAAVKQYLSESDGQSDSITKTQVNLLKALALIKSIEQVNSNNESASKALDPLYSSEKKSKEKFNKDTYKKNIIDNSKTQLVQEADKKLDNEAKKNPYTIKPVKENSGLKQNNTMNQHSQNQTSQSNKSSQENKTNRARLSIGKLDIVVMTKQVEKTNKKTLTRHNNNASQLLYLRGI